VRALLAFLAIESVPLSRTRICDLLWDVPNDPRGELRWCLSKLRSLLDDPDRRRVITSGHDRVALDLSDCVVDVVAIERAIKAGVANASDERLAELCDGVGGDLLDGTHIDGSPELTGWLAA
jgi:DNA-binding SARP family transcriptional activator